MAAYGVTRIVRTAVAVDSVLTYPGGDGERADHPEGSDVGCVLKEQWDRR